MQRYYFFLIFPQLAGFYFLSWLNFISSVGKLLRVYTLHNSKKAVTTTYVYGLTATPIRKDRHS